MGPHQSGMDPTGPSRRNRADRTARPSAQAALPLAQPLQRALELSRPPQRRWVYPLRNCLTYARTRFVAPLDSDQSAKSVMPIRQIEVLSLAIARP